MAIHAYHLAHEFLDAPAERSMLAAMSSLPQLYWQYADLLKDAFVVEQSTWETLRAGIIEERHTPLACEWTCAMEPEVTARRLADLRQRRLLADLQERMAVALHSNQPANELLSLLESEVALVRNAARETSGALVWAGELATEYLSMAERRRQQRETTGSTIVGIPTGLRLLDDLLNGLSTGLYILAGAPGVGKTTLSLQLALHAARQRIPAVYVTYENSPSNLVGKALCATANVTGSDVDRGYANLAALRAAEYELSGAMTYLAIVEGTSRLTVDEVKAKALQAMNRHQTTRCLVIFDYLQRAAQSKGFDGLRHNVSAMAGELRDLANRLQSPVLALSSQSRAGGNYGAGGGSASLDSLKESGDLEYSADAVMFLKPSQERPAVPPARSVDLVLAKNRFGDVGSIPLIFRADIGQMRQER